MIGVMGPGGSATEEQCELAYKIGVAIAEKGYTLLSGGMQGTMAAACKGAKETGGRVVGICPTDNAEDMCPHVDIAIVTAMKGGRNFINILSSHRVIAIGARSGGTLSEIAFAIQQKRPLLVVAGTPEMQAYLRQVEGGDVQFTDSTSGVYRFLSF